jgi:predicted DNA-binding protein
MIPAETHQRLKLASARQDRPMAAILAELVARHLPPATENPNR